MGAVIDSNRLKRPRLAKDSATPQLQVCRWALSTQAGSLGRTREHGLDVWEWYELRSARRTV